MENAVFDSDKFISIVQMHPALWDNSDGDYADKIKKNNGWRAVMSSMCGDEVQSFLLHFLAFLAKYHIAKTSVSFISKLKENTRLNCL
jgi:hypothetical protein